MGCFYGKKVILLLDEYDTPMQEAYVNDYWQEFASFIRSLFNSTFKINIYLERAVMTGITRVSKESIFSDLNNLRVVTTSSDMYEDSFGFTEYEVRNALEEYDMTERFDDVKRWYDGFIFGTHRDIYNPWSITYFLKEKQLRTYWASTSSNGLVNKLIRTGSPMVKETMESLINGNVDEMNIYMNEVAFATFGTFDTGNHPSGKSEPERFYHGFVLGLFVELGDRYRILSNREHCRV